MKNLASLLLAFSFASWAAMAVAKEPVRLDGTSEATFDASFSKLVRSLKAPERRTLALGLFGALLKHECLAPGAVLHLTFMPVEPKDAQMIRPCREHLNGMSYPEILQAGEPPAKEPAAEPPNSSSKPTPLRGAA